MNKSDIDIVKQYQLNYKNLNDVLQYCQQFVSIAMERLAIKNIVNIFLQVDYEIQVMQNLGQVKLDTKYNTCGILIHAAMFTDLEQVNAALMHQLMHCLTIQIKRYQQSHGQESSAFTVMFDNAYQLIANRFSNILEKQGIINSISEQAIANIINKKKQ